MSIPLDNYLYLPGGANMDPYDPRFGNDETVTQTPAPYDQQVTSDSLEGVMKRYEDALSTYGIDDDDVDALFANRKPLAEDGPAIILEGQELETFKKSLFSEMEAVIGGRGQLNETLRMARSFYNLERGPEPYPNAPNFTMPEVRSKVNGFAAAIRGSLSKDPFFTAKAYTEKASRSRPAWEAAMEHELKISGGRREINLAILEAGITGTGPITVLPEVYGREIVFKEQSSRLEDWYISPPGLMDTKDASTFQRSVKPLHIVLGNVQRGYYDRKQFEQSGLAKGSSVMEPTSDADRRGDVAANNAMLPNITDNKPVEMWLCYYRWGGVMFYVECSKETQTVFRLVLSPVRDAIGDRPPTAAFRPFIQSGMYYGDSYAAILMGIQGVLDTAMNSMLAYYQANLTPAEIIDETSVVGRTASKGNIIYPGGRRLVQGNPNEVVKYLTPPVPTNAERLIEVMKSLGNEVAFNDYPMGGGLVNTVRSPTEHNMIAQGAALKMSEPLDNIGVDLAELATIKWSMFYHLKVKPVGIYRVFDNDSNQYLLAPEEVSSSDIFEAFLDFNVAEGTFNPELAELLKQQPQLAQQLGIPTPDFFIAGVKRTDLTWEAQGRDSTAERANRAQTYAQVIAYLPVLQLAYQLRPVWEIMKAWMEAMGIVEWRTFLPAEPPDDSGIDFEQKMAMMASASDQMQSMRQGGSPGVS